MPFLVDVLAAGPPVRRPEKTVWGRLCRPQTPLATILQSVALLQVMVAADMVGVIVCVEDQRELLRRNAGPTQQPIIGQCIAAEPGVHQHGLRSTNQDHISAWQRPLKE